MKHCANGKAGLVTGKRALALQCKAAQRFGGDSFMIVFYLGLVVVA